VEIDSHKPKKSQKRALRPYEAAGLVRLGLPTFQAVAKACGPRLVPESTAARFNAIDKEHKEVVGFKMRHTISAAIAEGRQQHEKIHAAMDKGDYEGASNADLFTRDELAAEFQTKRRAADQRLHQLTEEARRLLVPIFEQIEAKALAMAQDLEREQRDGAKALGIDYKPGLDVVTLGQLSWRARVTFMPLPGNWPAGGLLKMLGQ
jgi:hypothetical protein